MSWQQLLDIFAEAAEEARVAKTQPPVACPLCGEPLESGPGGVLHCKFDGFLYPRDQVI